MNYVDVYLWTHAILVPQNEIKQAADRKSAFRSK